MLRHVVLLSLRPDTPSGAITTIVDTLRALPAQIDSIVEYQVGQDLALADGNAQIAVVADFAGTEGWTAYQQDPIHQQVIAELIKPHLAARAATQFST